MTYSAFSSLMFVLLQHFPYLNISVPHRYFCPFSHSNPIFKFFENSQKISKIFYMYLDKMEIHKIHLLTLRAPLQSCWQIKKKQYRALRGILSISLASYTESSRCGFDLLISGKTILVTKFFCCSLSKVKKKDQIRLLLHLVSFLPGAFLFNQFRKINKNNIIYFT